MRVSVMDLTLCAREHEERAEILAGVVRVPDHGDAALAHHVAAAHLRDEAQKYGRLTAHAVHALELLDRGLQHAVQRAEAVEQLVGYLIGVAAGTDIEQQKLEGVDVVKALKAMLRKALFHSLPVSVVCAHCHSSFVAYALSSLPAVLPARYS